MLIVLTTHPIQYQTPIYRLLAERGRIPFRVLFMSRQGLDERFDAGFGRKVAWDVDLLAGYPHEFLPAIRERRQGSRLWLRLDRGFATYLRESDATALWVQGWQVLAHWQAVAMGHGLGLPVWMRGDTTLGSRPPGRLRPIKDALIRRLFRKIDRFLVVGSANRALYRSLGVEEARLAPAPHCVDNQRFAKAAAELASARTALRARWGVPAQAACVLFVGKLQKLKRIEDLIAAMGRAGALTGERSWHLIVVGTGERAREARNACRVVFDAEAGGPVTPPPPGDGRPTASFLGFLNQSVLPEAYAVADVLALPSETETWGLVVNEAMASGRPAVVSDMVGCGDDLVRPLDPGLVFPVGDDAALADALVRAVGTPPPSGRIRSLIAAHDPIMTVNTVERLYAEAMSKGVRTSPALGTSA